jgi:hypothetical protein
MKPIKLKDILAEVYSRRPRGGYQVDAEFTTEVSIDLTKLDKSKVQVDVSTLGYTIQEDVDVEVFVQGSYDDARFDYEYGSERGTYDPGSGYVAEKFEIVVASDSTDDGEKTGQLVLKAGTIIPEEAVVNIQRLYDTADSELNSQN